MLRHIQVKGPVSFIR